MNSKLVRVGIVGLGSNGVAHLRAHLNSGASEIVAICDRDRNLVEKVGQEYGIRKRYAGDSIFDDQDIDAISINTGDNDHKTPCLKAIAAGKHVFVEKPLANSEDDVREMMDATVRATPGLKIQIGYILRFNPVFEEIHRLSVANTLGRLYIHGG